MADIEDESGLGANRVENLLGLSTDRIEISEEGEGIQVALNRDSTEALCNRVD